MSQDPQAPSSHAAPKGVDENAISRNALRRRIAIACGATAGVTFILAGLLAGSSVLPNVLDELREKDLLPVQMSGGGTASGQSGSQRASGSAGSLTDHAELGRSSTLSDDDPGAPGTPGAPGSPASEADAPNLILPGGINLNEVLDDTTETVDDRLDTAKSFVKEIVGQLPVSTTLPELPVSTTLPPLPVPTTLPELPVSTTLPPLPVPTTLPPLPVPTTVPAPLAPITTLLPGIGL